MMRQFRGQIGTYIIGGVIGFIAIVFVLEGALTNKATRGLHDSAVAGTVNGDPITLGEFSRALERRTEYIKGMMGGKITEEQMKMFRIREGTFQELVQQKLMLQSAQKAGVVPADEEVRQEVMKIDAFKKDGKFDPIQYKRVLEANNYDPSRFEKSIRDQLSVDAYSKNIMAQVRVSEAEIKEEFLGEKETRSLKLVTLLSDAPKSGELTPKEAAKKVVEMLKADKKSDEAVNALLKPFNAQVREIPNITKASGYLPGLSEDTQVFTEAFQNPSPLMGHAKTFESAGHIYVALVTDAKMPNLADFDKERSKYSAEVREKKQRAIMSTLMKQLTDKASIDTNVEVVSGGSADKG